MIDFSGCGFSDSLVTVIEKLYYFVYFILLPSYLLIGLLSHALLLAAFWKQQKNETGYTYQLVLTISKTFEILIFGTFLLALYSGAGLLHFSTPKDWFIKSYVLVYYTAKPGGVLHMFFILYSLLLAVVMTGDRVISLWKPFIYKILNHRRNQILAFVICAGLALLVNIDGYWYNEITQIDDHYEIIPNSYHINSTICHISSYALTTVRMGGLVMLVILNLAVIILYRKHMTRVLPNMGNLEKLKARKAFDRSLVLLSMCQSVLMCINQVPHALMTLVRQQSDILAGCGLVAAPFADGAIMVTDMLNLFVVLAINKKMRTIVAQVIPCMKVTVVNTVIGAPSRTVANDGRG